jgi:hypothetical protein
VVNNYRRTNLPYAGIITVLQIALAVICVPPLSLFLVISDLNTNRAPSDAQKVRVVLR